MIGERVIITSVSQPAEGALFFCICPLCASLTILHDSFAPKLEQGTVWRLQMYCDVHALASVFDMRSYL